MLKIDETAVYDKKDLANLFGKTTRTIERFYADGLPKRQIRGTNYTFGHEILKWLSNEDSASAAPINPKLVKFRQGAL